MNIKITCESESVVVPDQSRESILRAMKMLGYNSMRDDGVIQFYRHNGAGEIQARVTVSPTTDPVTPDEPESR
jgi:hypothetical protein